MTLDPDLGVDLLALARFTAGFEGFKDYVYDDKHPDRRWRPGMPVDGTLTIGYGETRPDLIQRYLNTGITQEEAWRLKAERLPGYVRQARDWIGADRWATLNPHQRGAIADMAYNAGLGNLQKYATDLRAAVRSGVGGNPLADIWARTIISPEWARAGLIRRRRSEADWYNAPFTPLPPPEPPDPLYLAGRTALVFEGERLS